MINLNNNYNIPPKSQTKTERKASLHTYKDSVSLPYSKNISFSGNDMPSFHKGLKHFLDICSKFLPTNIANFFKIHSIKKGALLDTKTFQELSETTKASFRKQTPRIFKQLAQENIQASLALKNYYDELYGIGQYNIVCIGRSPALVSKVLEHLGIEVKYLPISGVDICHSYKELEKNIIDAPNYLRYIKEIGLTKEQIQASTKKTIFFDYVDEGKTLNLIKQLFQEHFKLPKEKVDFRSFSLDLINAGKKNKCNIPAELIGGSFNSKSAEGYIYKYLIKSYSEQYSNIPLLPFSNLNSVYKEIKKTNNKISKIFNFTVLDILEGLKLLPPRS